MRSRSVLSPSISGAALVLVALTLAPGNGVAAPAPDNGALPPDLAVIPPDGSGFIAVRVADFWEKAEGVRKLAPENSQLHGALQGFAASLHLTPAEIERLIVILPPSDSPASSVTGFTLLRPIEQGKLLGSLVPQAKEKKILDRTVQVDELRNRAVYLVSDRSFLLGSPTDIEDFLKRSSQRRERPVLEAALARAAGKHVFVAGFNLTGENETAPTPLGEFLPLIRKAPGATITGNVDEGTLTLDVWLPLESEEAATARAKMAQESLDRLKESLPKRIAQLSKVGHKTVDSAIPDRARPFLRDVEAGLKEFQFRRTGKELRGTLHVKSDDPGSGVVFAVFANFIYVPEPPDKKP